jgi:RNase P/RNase MRP subunit p30
VGFTIASRGKVPGKTHEKRITIMDDLKLIRRSKEELRNEIKIVRPFSDDIKIKFGSEKCARISLKNGTVHRKHHIGNTMEN